MVLSLPVNTVGKTQAESNGTRQDLKRVKDNQGKYESGDCEEKQVIRLSLKTAVLEPFVGCAA